MGPLLQMRKKLLHCIKTENIPTYIWIEIMRKLTLYKNSYERKQIHRIAIQKRIICGG